MNDLAFDIVELVAWTPRPGEGSGLGEMGFRKNAWTPAQMATLRRMFAADDGLAEIAKATGRPLHGVRSKICELGLRRNSTRPWNDLEDAEVIRRYGREAAASIAQDLGRGVSAVYARASLLDLAEERPPAWTPWEDAQLRAGFAQGVPVAQLTVLIGRPMNGTRSRACDLGLRHANCPVDWSEAEMNRALELAESGLVYATIRAQLVGEGFPPRSSSSFKVAIRKLGYGRGWGRLWTPDEDELLRRAYRDGTSLTPLRERLGRTGGSIGHRAAELGLKGTHACKAGFRQGPDWTEAENALLRDRYGKEPVKSLAARLGRGLRAVYTHAFQLGLKHRGWSADDDRAIRIAWARGLSLAVLKRALGRDASVISKRAVKLGCAFTDPNRPTPMGRGRRKTGALPSLPEILAMDAQVAA